MPNHQWNLIIVLTEIYNKSVRVYPLESISMFLSSYAVPIHGLKLVSPKSIIVRNESQNLIDG